MGKATPENLERNKDLIVDYAKGMTVIDLEQKYMIGKARIYQILNSKNVRRERRYRKRK